MNDTFIFQGTIYPAKKGELIYINYNEHFGTQIKITTTDCEVTATRVGLDGGKLVYKILNVVHFFDNNKIVAETATELTDEEQEVVETPDFSKMKKQDLISYAKEHDIEIQDTTSITKKQLIKLITAAQ